MEGHIVPVHIYTNYHSVELFINGKSYGIRTHAAKPESADRGMGEVARYHLMWNDTIYEPGEVKAVAYDENGTVCPHADNRLFFSVSGGDGELLTTDTETSAKPNHLPVTIRKSLPVKS